MLMMDAAPEAVAASPVPAVVVLLAALPEALVYEKGVRDIVGVALMVTGKDDQEPIVTPEPEPPAQ